MSDFDEIRVGDWLRLESKSTGAQRFVRIERETNTQWVCSDEIRVDKFTMDVFGERSVSASPIAGVGANVAIVIDSDRKVDSANVIADLLDSDGYNKQATSVREAIAAYRAYVQPRDIKPLKPKWSKLNSYNYRAPREFRSRYELRTEDSILATIVPHNQSNLWSWLAEISGTNFSEVHPTVKEAKAAIRKARELGGKVDG